MKSYIIIISKLSIIWLFFLTPYTANAVVFSSLVALYKILLGEAHAWAISVKQTAVASNQIVQGINQNTKTLTQAINVIKQSESVTQAMVNYGMSFGQPNSTKCSALINTNLIIQKQDLANTKNTLYLQSLTSDLNSSSDNSTVINRGITHSKYCSNFDKQAGICAKVSKNQNADTNYSVNFSQSNLDEQQAQMANDYVKNVISPKIDVNNQCKTASCLSSEIQELKYNAFLSMAANSLYGQINQRKINP